eukprot:gene45230-60409_t
MSAFIGKIISYFASEALVKTLANNRAFQRFALTTDTFLNKNLVNAKQVGQETLDAVLKKGDKIIKDQGAKMTTDNAKQMSQNPFISNIFVYARAIRNEIKKDLK